MRVGEGGKRSERSARCAVGAEGGGEVEERTRVRGRKGRKESMKRVRERIRARGMRGRLTAFVREDEECVSAKGGGGREGKGTRDNNSMATSPSSTAKHAPLPRPQIP